MTRPAEIQAPRFQTSPDGLSVPKSCPFCRGEAAVNTIQWSAEHLAEQGLPEGIRFGVNCMRCGVNNRGGNGAATPDEAIARWNKRAEPVAIVALLAETARLEAALAVARADAARWRAVSRNVVGIDFNYEGPERDIVAAIIHLPRNTPRTIEPQEFADILVAQYEKLSTAAPGGGL